VVLALCLAAAWDGPVFPSRAPLFFSLTAIAAMAALAMTLTSPGRWRLALDRGPLPAIGRMSYAMYVLHYFVLGALLKAAGWRSSLALMLGVVVGSYALALLTWHALEQPMLSLKRFVPMPRASQGDRELPGHEHGPRVALARPGHGQL
jgi:peptidoglycan/LPS O-acetylase OafA/YrhL